MGLLTKIGSETLVIAVTPVPLWDEDKGAPTEACVEMETRTLWISAKVSPLKRAGLVLEQLEDTYREKFGKCPNRREVMARLLNDIGGLDALIGLST